jgi:hypothetical protein
MGQFVEQTKVGGGQIIDKTRLIVTRILICLFFIEFD